MVNPHDGCSRDAGMDVVSGDRPGLPMKEIERGLDPDRVIPIMQSIQRLCLSGWSFTIEHDKNWHVSGKRVNDSMLSGVDIVNRWALTMMTALEDIVDVADNYGEGHG